jgi:hypothetical protein
LADCIRLAIDRNAGFCDEYLHLSPRAVAAQG